jgi:type II restriction/modification system DNA methylase subunit YeeA
VCSFESGKKEFLIGLLCSKVNYLVQSLLNPTLNIQPANLRAIPLPHDAVPELNTVVNDILKLSKDDWDAFETSWEFKTIPLLQSCFKLHTIKESYENLRIYWKKASLDSQHLEQENNGLFIKAYGLQDELTPDVPLKEITLTCNPHYRYGSDKTEEELEALLLADTMKELISYAVGCMFGRYALDKPGLILANQGETIEDYLKQIPEARFPADEDNVIPMLDGDWFTDDIAERFRRFLRVTFGDEHYEENLKFIETAIGRNGKAQTIRDYFLKEFYTDHIKRYKKRPIYWLFSSPKGSFNALIYMHRYRPDTVGVVLNDYLREFRTKLVAKLAHLTKLEASADASKGEKVKALKEIDTIKKTIDELDTWERDVLYPLASKQIDIDLDDGVKTNYLKLGAALRKIPGLEAKED